VDEIYNESLKLLKRRDYSVAQLKEKLLLKFDDVPQEIIQTLLNKRFLDDARFARNFAAKRRNCHPSLVLTELLNLGVSRETADQTVSATAWPSLQDVLRATMIDWKLQPPLHRREAARLYRALARLGFPEDEIREELDQLHEQQ
jgi:SOS response regulatory protein OraA/RecX